MTSETNTSLNTSPCSRICELRVSIFPAMPVLPGCCQVHNYYCIS
uniref:Uncharacterized protein n=1 Tax=Amphimedon queenslandica TaxID=400682 RepID=A0A1X7UW48_AMPQE